MGQRHEPLIVIASAAPGVADALAERLRRDGSVVYATHSAAGCLRVATSVGPDIVVLDPELPARLERQLRAHPRCAQTRVLHLTDTFVQEVARKPLGKPHQPLHIAAA